MQPICNVEEVQLPKDHDMDETHNPMDIPDEMISQKRRPAWDRDVIQGAEKYEALEGRKISRIYSSYVALLCNLVDTEPTCFEEDTKKQEWMDAMLEEYQSIIKNDVLDVVSRPRGK